MLNLRYTEYFILTYKVSAFRSFRLLGAVFIDNSKSWQLSCTPGHNVWIDRVAVRLSGSVESNSRRGTTYIQSSGSHLHKLEPASWHIGMCVVIYNELTAASLMSETNPDTTSHLQNDYSTVDNNYAYGTTIYAMTIVEYTIATITCIAYPWCRCSHFTFFPSC